MISTPSLTAHHSPRSPPNERYQKQQQLQSQQMFNFSYLSNLFELFFPPFLFCVFVFSDMPTLFATVAFLLCLNQILIFRPAPTKLEKKQQHCPFLVQFTDCCNDQCFRERSFHSFSAPTPSLFLCSSLYFSRPLSKPHFSPINLLYFLSIY